MKEYIYCVMKEYIYCVMKEYLYCNERINLTFIKQKHHQVQQLSHHVGYLPLIKNVMILHRMIRDYDHKLSIPLLSLQFLLEVAVPYTTLLLLKEKPQEHYIWRD
jgi:hypothetical protein